MREQTLSDLLVDNPSLIISLQKGYIPQPVLIRLFENSHYHDTHISAWYSYLLNLAKYGGWNLAGNVEPEDFASCMLTGYVLSKETIQQQGGISQAQLGYDPTRKGDRPTICPDCGSSFWSHEHGNTDPLFADWEIPEFRSDPLDCPTPIRRSNGKKEQKVCGKILAGPFDTKEQARAHCTKNNCAIEINKAWFVACGHSIDLMSFHNYILNYVMKPLRAEHFRFATAKTKGRMNIIQGYKCPCCHHTNEAILTEHDLEESSKVYICNYCGTRHLPDELMLFTMERGSVSLSTPVGDDGKATIGDLLASPQLVDEELQLTERMIRETLGEFSEILQKIVDRKLQEAQSRLKDRTFTRIPSIERALRRARLQNNQKKLKEAEIKLAREQENLIKDQNKIDYTSSLVDMFRLHFIGDESGETWDYRRLSERFMFKSKPYTECQDCGHRDYEQNETGKIERDYEQAREVLRRLAEADNVPGYDRDQILNTPISKLLPELGSVFYCSKCNSIHLKYYGPGSKNPTEPRIDITPHIFQPAQREIDELKSEIFSYKLRCPACQHENLIRPDKASGKLLDHKISKRTIEEDGKRHSVRKKVEHSCAKCNHPLTLEDKITSKEQEAYSLLIKLRELILERDKLRAAKRSGGDFEWTQDLS